MKRVILSLVTMTLPLLLVSGLAQAQTAPDEVPDASCPTNSGPANLFSVFGTVNTAFAAQTFTAEHTGLLTNAEVEVAGTQNEPYGIVMEIRAVDTSGTPTEVVLASTTIQASDVPIGWNSAGVTGHFSPGAPVEAGQQYAIALRTSTDVPNGESGPYWIGNFSNPCSGVFHVSNDSSPEVFQVESPNWDLFFSTFVTPRAAPANDNFADAQTISGESASVEGTTAKATREIGEPDHYTSNPADANWWLGDHTVWYRWTAPSSGLTSVDTCTANIDSILAVYTGGSLNSLSRVADNNNDYCGGGWGSKVTFEAAAGTTYQIAVGDAGGLRENTFTLNLESEGTPVDTTAPIISGVPSDITATSTDSNGALVSWQAPTATDDVDGTVDVECSPASGSLFPIGTTQVNCSASDAAGNHASGSFEVKVVYDFGNGSGGSFGEPVRDTELNRLTAGAGVPVKFGLGADYGLNIFAEGYPKSKQIDCSTGLPTDPVEETSTVTKSGLTYDVAGGLYTYVWKTDKAWKGTCRELNLKLADGTDHLVKFQFK